MFDQVLFLVFFVYGLAFFGMGLALAFESGRSPALAEARILRPLAAFGILHGIHEWLESYLLQAQLAGTLLPGWIAWLRLGLLTTSFISLFFYGIRTFRMPGYKPMLGMRLGLIILGVYGLVILASAIVTYRLGEVLWANVLDGLSRYLLAVPGAALAALALRFQAGQAGQRGQRILANSLTVTAIAFGLYSLTQVFVPPLEMAPAHLLNAQVFREFTGFPIQFVRSLLAIAITFSLLRATQETEKERQSQLETARKARLEALEQVQAELTKREAMRRELLRHTVRAQEEERARIARELHDETSQTLAAFGLDLAALQAMLPAHAECKTLVDRLQTHARDMSRGLYRLVHDLRPAQLDDLGLVPALQYLSDQDAPSKGLAVQLDIAGTPRRLDTIVETALFRVAQEALTNVARHAGVKQARLKLKYTTREIVLTVADSGAGFDPGKSFVPPHGWGMAGMRERVEAVGGDLNIQSTIGKGTTVEVIVPVFDLLP